MKVKILECFPIDAEYSPVSEYEISLRGQVVEIEYMFGDKLYGFNSRGESARQPNIIYLYEEEFEVLDD